ncbi:MAG: hypothetical protein JWN34_449 [Bryobacterales bacterium]|nr:hypothetical protein [Bryobacterales bacterium]
MRSSRLLSFGQVATVDLFSTSRLDTLRHPRTLGLLPLALVALFSSLPAHAQQQSTEEGVSLVGDLVTSGSEFTGADLDGDRQADFIVSPSHRQAHKSGHTVEVRLSRSHVRQTLNVSGPGGGFTVTARDIDGDLDLDLVFTSRVTGQGISVWMNDGNGVFTEGDPSHRQLWVWGHGAQLREGLPEEARSDALAASGDELVAAPVGSAPLASQSLLTPTRASGHSATHARGAFYIRPPPNALL